MAPADVGRVTLARSGPVSPRSSARPDLQRCRTRRAADFRARPALVPRICRQSAVEPADRSSARLLPARRPRACRKRSDRPTTYLSGNARNASRYGRRARHCLLNRNLLPPIATGTRCDAPGRPDSAPHLRDPGPCLVEEVVEDEDAPAQSDASANARSLAVMSAVWPPRLKRAAPARHRRELRRPSCRASCGFSRRCVRHRTRALAGCPERSTCRPAPKRRRSHPASRTGRRPRCARFLDPADGAG